MVKENITFCEIPESISFDDIHELLWKANEKNREDGFVLSTSKLSGQELQKRIGLDGYCFVALDNDKLIGTMSIRFVERNTWYTKGKTPEMILVGVLPEYQGKHIFTGLFDLGIKNLKELGYSAIECDTAANNIFAINKYKHLGYRLISYKTNPKGDHYSVIMMKWFNVCPHSSTYIKLRFYTKKILVTARYTPDKKKRFGI